MTTYTERAAQYAAKILAEVETLERERQNWRRRCEHAESMLSDEQMAEHVDVCGLDTGRSGGR